MQIVKQELIFSTVVSESTDVNDFIVEFMNPEEGTDCSPIKVTRNFEELLQFLGVLEES
ncbi:hypothetical protein [Neobacillus sp. PS2-9]|uniref:hypothetical protein n=1 Tax=Neobacillus sp. PS2-9 TaxID=3070676 RepID=UPI0027DF4D96|nr:hypothetical protein [Neobacillus sp. PS2-9]WML60592.1 hypothetical protein RCG25_12865 [Neobacillus sp. PS2-9]